MRYHLKKLALSAFTLLLFTGVVWAAVHPVDPGVHIPYQGTLYDGVGAATGDYELTFELYDAESAGTQLFTETVTIPVSAGRFAHVIGSSNALVRSELAGRTPWLQITVEGAVLGTRVRVYPAPTATTAMTGHNLSLTTERALSWLGWNDMVHLDDSAGHGAISLGDMFFGLHSNKSFYWADQSLQQYAMQLDTTNNTLTVTNVQTNTLTTEFMFVNTVLDVNGPTVTDNLRVGAGGSLWGTVRSGTAGVCGDGNAGTQVGGAGTGTAVTFGFTYGSSPLVLAQPHEWDNNGCTSTRVTAVSTTGFTVQGWHDASQTACDCVQWIAIGQ